MNDQVTPEDPGNTTMTENKVYFMFVNNSDKLNVTSNQEAYDDIQLGQINQSEGITKLTYAEDVNEENKTKEEGTNSRSD